MCLTIPKKVIVIEKNFVIVENPSGDRQKVKSMIDLKIGDYCLAQQGLIIDKIDKREAHLILKTIKRRTKNERYNV